MSYSADPKLYQRSHNVANVTPAEETTNVSTTATPALPLKTKTRELKIVAHPFGAWTLWGFYASQVGMPTPANPNPSKLNYFNCLFIHATWVTEYVDA